MKSTRKATFTDVFQYGSNTFSRRLNCPERLSGAARSPRLAQTVRDYDLAFTTWSKGNNCAAADLVRGRGRQIFGVLYCIPRDRVRKMRTTSGKTLREIEGPNYYEAQITVRTRNGRRVRARTFLVRPSHRQEGIETSACYVDHILTGLRQHGAPAEYIRYVKERAISNNPDLKAILDP